MTSHDETTSGKTVARYTRAQFFLALIVAAVGFGSGFIGGRGTAPVETVTATVRAPAETVTVTNPEGAADTRPCVAGGAKTRDDREPNNRSGQAGGPVESGVEFSGRIATTNDQDFFALCVGNAAELQFALDCTDAPRDGCSAFAGFGLEDDPSAGYFEAGQPLGCTVDKPGRYFIRIQANDYPLDYQVTVDSEPATALVASLSAPLAVSKEPCT